MAEINLLQNTNNQNTERKTQHILNTVGVIILLAVAGAYAALFVLTSKIESDSKKYADDQSSLQQKISTAPEYSELIDGQTKIKMIEGLLKNHTYWCAVLPHFAQETLKATKYSKFTANSDGSATITGSVPDFQNLAKLIQAYQFNNDKFVKDVKLVNVGLGSEQKNDIAYTVDVTFNKDVLANYTNKCN